MSAVVIPKHLLSPGTHTIPHPQTGEPMPVQFTADDCRQFAITGNRMIRQGFGVPVPLEHQDGAGPVSPEEKAARSVSHNTGWVNRFLLDDAGNLWGELAIEAIPGTPREEIEDALRTRIKYVSPELWPSLTLGDGSQWQNVVKHVALTCQPVFQGQRPFGEAPDHALALSLAKQAPRWTAAGIPARFSGGWRMANPWQPYMGKRGPRKGQQVGWQRPGPGGQTIVKYQQEQPGAHETEGEEPEAEDQDTGPGLFGEEPAGPAPGKKPPATPSAKEALARLPGLAYASIARTRTGAEIAVSHVADDGTITDSQGNQWHPNSITAYKRPMAPATAAWITPQPAGASQTQPRQTSGATDLFGQPQSQAKSPLDLTPTQPTQPQAPAGVGPAAGVKPPPEKPQAAPAAPTPPEGEERGDVVNAPIAHLAADPKRFQYKISGIDPRTGVTEELKAVHVWNPDFAGVIAVWKDPKDGRTYVINGHHRYELAKRLGVKKLAIRYLDAATPEEARAKGALINIAEGRGTAVDAAKFLRDMKATPEDFTRHGISLKGKVARDAVTLSGLSDRGFQDLTNGLLSEEQALAVARHCTDHAKQDHIFQLVRRADHEIDPKHLEEMARAAAVTPTGTRGGTLFGDLQEDLWEERADIASYVRGRLVRSLNNFKAVSSEQRAKEVGAEGNVIDTAKNKQRAKEAEAVYDVYDRLLNRKGAIAQAVAKATVQLSQAPTEREKNAVRQQALAEVSRAIQSELAGEGVAGQQPGVAGGGTQGGQGPHGGTPAPTEDQGPGAAGPGDVKPLAAVPAPTPQDAGPAADEHGWKDPPLEVSKHLSPEEQKEERELQLYARKNWQTLRQKYIDAGMGALNPDGSLKSIQLNTDEWRELLPGYTGTNANIGHEAASYLNKRLSAEALRVMRGKGNGRFLVLAGGGGSGKGSAAKKMDMSQYPIVLDQVSDHVQKLDKKLQEARDAGFQPEIVFVDRHPRDAWLGGVVPRALNSRKKGQPARTVPLNVALRANIEARKAALHTLKNNPDLPVSIIDNNFQGGGNNARLIMDRQEAIKFLESQQHDYDALYQELHDATRGLHERGDIPADIAAGLIPQPAGQDRRLQPGPQPGDGGARPQVQPRGGGAVQGTEGERAAHAERAGFRQPAPVDAATRIAQAAAQAQAAAKPAPSPPTSTPAAPAATPAAKPAGRTRTPRAPAAAKPARTPAPKPAPAAPNYAGVRTYAEFRRKAPAQHDGEAYTHPLLPGRRFASKQQAEYLAWLETPHGQSERPDRSVAATAPPSPTPAAKPAATPAPSRPSYAPTPPRPPVAATPEQKQQMARTVLDAFDLHDRAKGRHNFVSLVDVRKTLAQKGLTTREQQDDAIDVARRAGLISASAAEGRFGLTPEDLRDGLREDGALLLYLSRRQPKDDFEARKQAAIAQARAGQQNAAKAASGTPGRKMSLAGSPLYTPQIQGHTGPVRLSRVSAMGKQDESDVFTPEDETPEAATATAPEPDGDEALPPIEGAEDLGGMDLGDELGAEEPGGDWQTVANEIATEFADMGIHVPVDANDAVDFLRHLATALKTHLGTKALHEPQDEEEPPPPDAGGMAPDAGPPGAGQEAPQMVQMSLQQAAAENRRLRAQLADKTYDERCQEIDRLVTAGKVQPARAQTWKEVLDGARLSLVTAKQPDAVKDVLTGIKLAHDNPEGTFWSREVRLSQGKARQPGQSPRKVPGPDYSRPGEPSPERVQQILDEQYGPKSNGKAN